MTYPELAKRLGVPENALRKLGCGSVRTTSARRAQKIHDATDGEISRESLVFDLRRTP